MSRNVWGTGCSVVREQQTSGEKSSVVACTKVKVKVKVKVKGKVKFTLEQATKAKRGSRCIALLFL
jgi:hypothetical protein